MPPLSFFTLCHSAKTFIFSFVASELFDVCCTSRQHVNVPDRKNGQGAKRPNRSRKWGLFPYKSLPGRLTQ